MIYTGPTSTHAAGFSLQLSSPKPSFSRFPRRKLCGFVQSDALLARLPAALFSVRHCLHDSCLMSSSPPADAERRSAEGAGLEPTWRRFKCQGLATVSSPLRDACLLSMCECHSPNRVAGRINWPVIKSSANAFTSEGLYYGCADVLKAFLRSRGSPPLAYRWTSDGKLWFVLVCCSHVFTE